MQNLNDIKTLGPLPPGPERPEGPPGSVSMNWTGDPVRVSETTYARAIHYFKGCALIVT